MSTESNKNDGKNDDQGDDIPPHIKAMGWSVTSKDVNNLDELLKTWNDNPQLLEQAAKQRKLIPMNGVNCSFDLEKVKNSKSSLLLYILTRCPGHNLKYFWTKSNEQLLRVAVRYQNKYNNLIQEENSEIKGVIPMDNWFKIFEKERKKQEKLLSQFGKDSSGEDDSEDDSDASDNDSEESKDDNNKGGMVDSNDSRNKGDSKGTKKDKGDKGGVRDKRTFEKMNNNMNNGMNDNNMNDLNGEKMWYDTGYINGRGGYGEPPHKRGRKGGKSKHKSKTKHKHKHKRKGRKNKNKNGKNKRKHQSDTDSVSFSG